MRCPSLRTTACFSSLVVLAGVLGGAVLPAQDPPLRLGPDAIPTAMTRAAAGHAAKPSRPAPILGLTRGAGLQWLDGALVGGGNDYKVRFDRGGFEFTPAFGRAAPHDTPLRFSVADVRRGGLTIPIAPDAAPVPSIADRRVDYDHGACVERYEVRPDGVEQSFVFASLPEGEGDLVVLGRLECELPVTTDAGGVTFEMNGVGRFRIGSVVGVDADGRRAPGTIRVVDQMLELSLPDAFVADAALPLTLDPLIGNPIDVSGVTPADDQHPHIAYDMSADRYLVVWERIISATNVDILGRMVNGDGSVAFNLVFIETSSGFEYEPSVANVNLRNAFVVTYTRAGRVFARAADANLTGIVSAEVEVAGKPSSVQHYADLGSEATLNDDTALCVWKSDGDQAVLAREVGITVVNGKLTAVATAPVVTVAGANHETPRISRSGGAVQRYAVVTNRILGPADQDPYVTIVDGRGQPLTTPVPMTTSSQNQLEPTIDGDGTNWVAAWTHVVGTNSSVIHTLPLSFDARTSTVGFNGLLVPISLGGPEISPSVCWVGGSCVVGLTMVRTQDVAGIVNSADLFRCTPCEPPECISSCSPFNHPQEGSPQGACKPMPLSSPSSVGTPARARLE